MNLGLRLAAWAIGLMNAGFIGIVAAELSNPAIGWILGGATLALEAWAFQRVRTLIAQPQVEPTPQETQT